MTYWSITLWVGLYFGFSDICLMAPIFFPPLFPQIGQRQQVLVTEESFDSKFYVAHNRFYEQVRDTPTLSGFLQNEKEF